MTETLKEKRLRYILILLFISITVIGLLWDRDDNEQIATQETKALVLVQGVEETGKQPLVILANSIDEINRLTLFEVQTEDDYYFKSIQSMRYTGLVKEYSLDKQDRFFWTNIEDTWRLFDYNLTEIPTSDLHSMEESSTLSFTLHDTYALVENGIRLPLDKKVPVEIHLLESPNTYLVVYENEVEVGILKGN
ncbi:hypothetical protein Q73_11110 [Bacillus coahuilensis m2-6]|uniref:hypothetical protein n=1 Tax=Bacillus coahuilensis TaxID=408580 RepID=UPI000494B5EB|nr:hypothetical protein [Bacillus coahuilensis]KUP06691.1 hypothetical protein Q73_11110 [Bacillus coahuilensis m2-6]